MRPAIFSLAILVGAVSAVRADFSHQIGLSPDSNALSSGLLVARPFETGSVPGLAAPSGPVGRGIAAGAADPLTLVASPVHFSFGLPDGSLASGADREITQLPPPPSGDVLCLTGLLSIGALQLLRRVSHTSLPHVPEWYHAACPQRIGHAIPFDFGLSVLPLRAFECLPSDANQRPALAYRLPREPCSRFLPQAILLIAAPRGPPVLS
jgi:hypothetical protein